MSDRTHSPGLGCLTILAIGLVVIVMLLINSLIVKAFLDSTGALAEDHRVLQTLQFVLPVVMMVVEYWLFDFLRRNR